MKIVYMPSKYLVGYSYLLLLGTWGIIIGIFQVYKLLYTHYIGIELIIPFIYSIACIFFSWYIYILLKCNHYIIELNDNKFKHKIIFSKDYLYSEIKDIYIIEMKTRSGRSYNILKIKMKATVIRLRIDNLSDDKLDNLIDFMRTKTRRKYILYKDKRNKLFPLI